jgi:hypothetical protein
MGLYNYDQTIFDNLTVPTGVEKEKLVNNIILETAELECIYPSPNFLKTAIGLWANVEFMTWERIYAAATAEYNPIENYDRQETESTTGNRQHSGKDIASGSQTVTGSENGTTTNKIAGFDSTVLVDHDSTTGTNSRSGSTQDTNEFTHGEQVAESGQRTSRIHGNIGVTTSQQMLEQELQIAGKLNIYRYITDEFKKRFCILVY